MIRTQKITMASRMVSRSRFSTPDYTNLTNGLSAYASDAGPAVTIW